MMAKTRNQMDHRDIMVDLETIVGVFESIETAFAAPPEMDIFIVRRSNVYAPVRQ